MRRRESLVQIDMHHVEAHIARTTRPQHRIQVGTIVVHQTTTVMDEFGNLWDTHLEETEGIGIGHHHGSNLLSLLGDNTLQVVEIHRAIGQ